MPIAYSDRKDLPGRQIADLFYAVGWSDQRETDEAHLKYYALPFINSTFVISAWDGETLVGCVRALSDQVFRSVIYDLAVLPGYQGQGIGKELLRLCRAQCPGSEWLLATVPERVGFYEKQGFQRLEEPVMQLPCQWF